MDYCAGIKQIPIQDAMTSVALCGGALAGDMAVGVKRLSELKGVFADEFARASMPQDAVIYTVHSHVAEREGTPGGLFFGTSFLNPGRVGDEYYMTRGHFHRRRDTAEYYWCLQGEGVLLRMDENRRCTAERMAPGSLHYICGHVAHRLVNTGGGVLAVGACWPSDAGHDYQSIEAQGFSARVVLRDCQAVVLAQGGCP